MSKKVILFDEVDGLLKTGLQFINVIALEYMGKFDTVNGTVFAGRKINLRKFVNSIKDMDVNLNKFLDTFNMDKIEKERESKQQLVISVQLFNYYHGLYQRVADIKGITQIIMEKMGAINRNNPEAKIQTKKKLFYILIDFN